MKKLLIWLVLLLFLAGFFSYRILQTPLGLTADEGAFGLNAVLLSQSLHDENGRFLPFFVLSLDGTDWRQPVTQYYLATFFKLFGSSVFALRFSSVVLTLGSAVLLYYLAKRLESSRLAYITFAVFLTTPLVMIQSHLGLDNLMPVPFTLLWLVLINLFDKSKKPYFLLLAGFSLGIAFYSYKGMRAVVPVWCIVTALYLARDSFLTNLKKITWFSLGVLPFFLIIPLLNLKYPGAVFDRHGWASMSLYEFVLPYLSSYDPSFLFVTGDATPWHSTGLHGMFLLASAPLFIIGLVQAFKKKDFWWLVLASFFTAPLLYGFVGSIHRASRLMSIIPQFSLLAGLGGVWLWHKRKPLFVGLGLLVMPNYADFTHFYWYKYPELTRQWFGDLTAYQDYVTLGKKAVELELKPYIDQQIVYGEGHSGRFFEAAYLKEVHHLVDSKDLPPGSILLTPRADIQGLTQLDVPTSKYHILVQ